MYRSFDETNGMPPRIYRSPEQIRNDILEIRSRIGEIKENLNIRELISDIIIDDSVDNLLRRADSVRDLLQYATEALSELEELNSELDELKIELAETLSYI